nr:tandem large repeat [Enterovibrio nigricans]
MKLAPLPPVQGQESTVTLTFSKPVKGVQASLGQESLIFDAPETFKSVWTTKVNTRLQPDSSMLDLTVTADYQDEVGNTGTRVTNSWGVKPVLSVDTIQGDNVINADEAARVVINGTGLGFAVGDDVTIQVRSDKIPSSQIIETVKIRVGGAWSTSTINLAEWEPTPLTITVSGTNDQFQSADEVRVTGVNLDHRLPRVDSVVFNPLHANVGENVETTIIFSKAVTSFEAKLGTNSNITLTDVDKDGITWRGAVKMPAISNVEQVVLSVVNIRDTAGNRGDDVTSYSIPYSPGIQYTDFPIRVNSAGAAELTLRGAFTRVKSASVSLKLQSAADALVSTPESALTFDSADKTWSSAAFDITAFEDGQVNLVFSETVTLENNQTVPVSEFIDPKFFTLDTSVATVIQVDPVSIANDSSGVVNVIFSDAVSTGKGRVTINSKATTLTGTGDRRTATTNSVMTLSPVVEKVSVAISEFESGPGNIVETVTQDLYTNVRWVMTPNRAGKYNKETARNITIFGETTGLSKGKEIIVEASKEGTSLTSERATVNNVGEWSVNFNLSAHNGQIDLVARAQRETVQTSLPLTIEIDAIAPTVTMTPVLSPQMPESEQLVSLMVDFNEKVKSIASASLNNSAINWSTTEPSNRWSGSVTLRDLNKVQVELSINGVEDEVGNVSSTAYTHSYDVKPVVTINPASITPENATALTLQGKALGFGTTSTDKIVVRFVNPESSQEGLVREVRVDGTNRAWALNNLDVSELEEGLWHIEVQGENARRHSSDVVQQEVTLSHTAPELGSATFSKPHAKVGERIDVSLTFNKVVSGIRANLGTESIALTNTSGNTWEGSANVPNVVDTDAVQLTVSDYTDGFGNVGIENTTYLLPYSPEVSFIDFPVRVNLLQGKNLSFGVSFEHVSSASIAMKLVSADNASQTEEKTLSFNSGSGVWSVGPYDLSTFSDGVVNLVFSGEVTIAQGVTVSASDLFTESKSFTYSSAMATVESIVPQTIEQGSAGVVTVTFTQNVIAESASVSIDGRATRLSGSGKVWIATTNDNLFVGANEESVNVEVSGFEFDGMTVEPITQAVATNIAWELGADQNEVYNQVQAQNVTISGTVTASPTTSRSL